MNTAEAASVAEDIFVDESPVLNGLRYFAMRLVRMVLSICAEVSMLSLCLVVAASLFLCVQIISVPNAESIIVSQYGEMTWRSVWFRHPFIAIIMAVACLPISFGALMSLSMPYKYKTRVPGSGVVRCGSCGHAVADELKCMECGAFRPYRIATLAVGLLNLLMTVAWAVHDIVFCLVTVWTGSTDFGSKE